MIRSTFILSNVSQVIILHFHPHICHASRALLLLSNMIGLESRAIRSLSPSQTGPPLAARHLHSRIANESGLAVSPAAQSHTLTLDGVGSSRRPAEMC